MSALSGNQAIEQIRQEIISHESNAAFLKLNYQPLFVADQDARIVIVGHAPGIKAQSANLTWGDASGVKLMQWLGINEATFRDKEQIALIPMDFYYQGKGKSGDLPPRKEFAPMWHEKLFDQMPHIELILLVGAYSQKYYLGKNCKKNLTETVRAYEEYLPLYFPTVHPSPLNFRWFNRNPWFESEVVPVLQNRVKTLITPILL